MKGVWNVVKRTGLYIWQLPQNIVGLLLLVFITGEVKHRLGSIRFFYAKSFPGGITLGEYIIVGTRQEFTVRHEFGHVLQSRYLGPLFIPVVGVFSLVHAGVSDMVGCCERHKEGYYHFWTEAWANRLAGIRKKDKTV